MIVCMSQEPSDVLQQLEAAAGPEAPDPSQPQQPEADAEEGRSGTTEQLQDTAEAANGVDRQPAATGTGRDDPTDQPPASQDDFRGAMHELLKWVPAKDPKVTALYASYEAGQERPASACRAMAKSVDSDGKAPLKKDLVARAELFRQLGWKHWHLHELSRIKLLFPKSYPLF